MDVFVDTSAFISSLNKKDSNHKKALQLSDQYYEAGFTFLTSNIVVYEVYTVLSLRVDKRKAFQFREVNLKRLTPIIYLDEELEKIAWQIFERLTSKNVSFFDCTSFAVIEKYKLGYAFSFDKDFAKFCRESRVKLNEI